MKKIYVMIALCTTVYGISGMELKQSPAPIIVSNHNDLSHPLLIKIMNGEYIDRKKCKEYLEANQYNTEDAIQALTIIQTYNKQREPVNNQ